MIAANESNLEMPGQLPQWLRKIPFFTHLDDAKVGQLIDAGHLEKLPGDQQLMGVGESGNRLLLVCEGSLVAQRSQEHEIQINPGQAICTGALFDDQIITHAITTAGDTTLFVLPREAFAELLYHSADMTGVVLEALDRVRRSQRISLLRAAPAQDALSAAPLSWPLPVPSMAASSAVSALSHWETQPNTWVNRGAEALSACSRWRR